MSHNGTLGTLRAKPPSNDAGLGAPVQDFGRSSFDMTAVTRGGFSAARRHSARVRLFRRIAIGISILAILLISAAVLPNPLKRLPGDISIGRVGVEGTKITVESPKITGVQRDGNSFEITAQKGIQDLKVPNRIELLGIDSKIGTSNTAMTLVSATQGLYDSVNDKISLKGDIRIKNSSTGYDIRLKTAQIDFKTGGLVSDEPVKVLLDGGIVAASSLDVSENGHKVSFGGEVSSMLENGASNGTAGSAVTEADR